MKVLLTNMTNKSYTAELDVSCCVILSNDVYNIRLEVTPEIVSTLKEKGVYIYTDGHSPLIITLATE